MPASHTQSKPIVGITLDAEQLPTRIRLSASLNYADRVAAAGGLPLMLPPIIDQVAEHAELCDAFVLTGGDDPCTEPFGVPTHKEATRVLTVRQEYETVLLERLATPPYRDKPVLGVCLGMQMMALVAGGRLNQHLPDTHSGAALHWDNTHPISLISPASPVSESEVGDATPGNESKAPGCTHRQPGGTAVGVADPIAALLRAGDVHSRHRQAVDDAGSMAVLARAPDGVIEAIADPSRAFYIGVQWHPERTADAALGAGLFAALVGVLSREELPQA